MYGGNTPRRQELGVYRRNNLTDTGARAGESMKTEVTKAAEVVGILLIGKFGKSGARRLVREEFF